MDFREYFIISIYNFTDTLGDRFVLLNDYIMYFGNKRKYDVTKKRPETSYPSSGNNSEVPVC